MKHFILMTIITLFIGCGSSPSSEVSDTPYMPEKQQAPNSAEDIFTIGDDQNVLEGSSVKITASILDDSKEFTKFTWIEDGKIVSTSEEFIADNLSAGEHHISLEVVDQDGNIYEDTVVVIIKKELTTNKPPVAKSLNFELKEDEQFLGSLGGSDEDGDELSYLFVSFPQHGRLSGSAANLRYTPNANYNGSDSFIYKTNDGTIDSQYATVSINIEAVNDAPAATAQSITLAENSSKNITLTGTDIEHDNLTFTVIAQPVHGTFDGIIYTPNPSYNGTDSFTFIANDSKLDSLPSTISIMITPVNDAPVLDEISPFSITEDILLNGTFIATDADSDDILTFSTSGSLEGFTLEDNGTFSFNPSHLIYQSLNVGDEIIQSIPIIVTDGILDVNKSFNIQITGQNDVPIAHYDYNQTNEDSNLSFNLLINDIDVDNNATLTLIDVNATEGNFTFTADGNLTFFPNGDYDYLTENQERNITLVYMIEDEHHEASEANVTISIHGINNAPTITAIDSITIDENISTGIGQIVASDAENSSLTFESNSTLVSIDNNGTYTFDTDGLYDNLAEGETKIIPIMITISDGVNSITRDINVTIIGVNTPPTVEIGADYNITEGDTLSFGITSSEDVDGSITQHRWSIDGVEASTATSVEHTFTAQGTYTVTLIVTDDKNATGSDSLIVTVNSLPDVNTISFTPHTVTMSAIKPEWLEMVDLDQDGDLDILTAGDGGTKIGWYENRGDFSFTEHSIATTELEPEAIKVADMDSDGDLDILYTTYNDSGRSLIQCLNDGSESFTTCSKITDQTATAVAVANISFIEIAYINDDTKPDIVSSSWGTPNTINWYENLGDGNYSQAKEIATLSNVPSLRSADINGDTYIDIVAASHGENRTVWYENDGNGAFTERTMPGTVFGAYSVEIMDKSNDGDIDVISTSNTDGKISIHHNDGTSTPSFTTKAILAHHLKNIHYASGADMDNDGDIDIIAASSEDNGRIAWYENIQDNLDYPEHNITLGVSNIVRVFAADIDNDGNMDIVSCAEDGNVTFYENNEADPLTLLPKTGATMLTAGDDGDLQKGADYTYTKADRIVTNNITDLMWQYDSSEHGADTIYQSTAVNNCKNLNITGYNDWRLPEIHELYYLLDRRNTPAISSIFDGTQTNDGYWVSDNKNGDYSWVDFLNATGNISYIFSFPKKYVRCVRGKKYEMKFIRNDTLEVVTDHKHNLQWQDNAVVTSSAKTWNEAIDYCSTLDLDGTGWRLPNINELYSIVKLYQSPAIHESFVNTTTDNYWSSTADASGVVAIYFWHGVDNGGESVDSTHKVRCVRDVI